MTDAVSAVVDHAALLTSCPPSDERRGPEWPAADEIEQLRADLATARAKIDNLEAALRSSRRIGAAVGIFMVRLRITQDAAFELLRDASQHQQRKVRDIAEEILYTGSLDGTFTGGHRW